MWLILNDLQEAPASGLDNPGAGNQKVFVGYFLLIKAYRALDDKPAGFVFGFD